jgi:ABC-2 type transport system ATP-binding protein
MIEVKNLTKKFGSKVAVGNISFKLSVGKITGFLGPNGAGKTTTMRCILGLEEAQSGAALVDGVPYAELKNPTRSVGAMIDAKAFHKDRSVYDHLLAVAVAAGIAKPKERIEEVLKIVGLADAAKKKVGKFSLGMTQRAGIAAALLGKPENLILDEPVNGLDPEGVLWIRELCRSYAQNGSTVFVSSHLMSEVENLVDEVIVIGRGKILEQGKLADVLARSGEKNLEAAFMKLTRGAQEFKTEGLPVYGA